MHENFQTFLLEREMGLFEHEVEYNLSESGVHPMTTRELLGGDPRLIEEFLDLGLNYPPTSGLPELRSAIAGIYSGAKAEDVIVTTGAAQANFTTVLTMLDPGDEIVIMLPNYMQIWGIAKNLNLNVKTFSLKQDLGWGFDIDEFNSLVTDKTKMIAICNPNNPTGHIMTAEERDAVIAAASKVGAWLLSDEVYAGAEHNTDEVTPSMFGEYERVFAIGSMSKAYALPGLRIGWVASNPEITEAIWARQDYVTICPGFLGNKLAAYALSPDVRKRILARTREFLRNGYAVLDEWVQEHSNVLSVVRPQAAAISFVHYNADIPSADLVTRLRTEYSTYVVPGINFGMDNYLRISYGVSDAYVREGLRRVFEGIIASV